MIIESVKRKPVSRVSDDPRIARFAKFLIIDMKTEGVILSRM